MVLAFAGNFDWDSLCSMAEKSCNWWKKQSADRKIEHFGGSKKIERLEKANLSYEHICLISPAVSMQDERRFAASILATIVGDSVGSRYFWALVDNALADTAMIQCESMDGTGAFYSYIRCSSENVAKVHQVVKEIFEELNKDGVTEDELLKARNKILSSLVLRSESPMGRLVGLGFNWTYLQQYRTVEQDIEDIKAITVEDVNALIKEFNLGCFTQFSLGPVSRS
jgi:predicted Zn-dependent peptidase